MDDTVSLRCKHCGAPFDVSLLTSDNSYITCGSCGTSQTRVDAKEYLEQMMGQVKSWISKAIPVGVNISGSDNVDAVARHNIFSNSVRPAIDTEMTEYRFGLLSLLSNQLMMMPGRNTSYRSPHPSAKAFEFNARVRSVAPLAVDADSREIMGAADKMSLAYALMINNMKLLAENKPERYTMMAGNFAEAADSLKGLKKYDIVRQRIEALSQVSKGVAFLEEGNVIESRAALQNGLTMIEAVRQATMTSMDFGSTYMSVDQEVAVTKVLLGVAETALHDPSLDPLSVLDIFRRVMEVATIQYRSSPADWGGMFKSLTRYNEIFTYISQVFASRSGKGGVPITNGAGSALIPFWSVDLKYSFTTGALFAKKSVEVHETLLIPATFVTDPNALSNPRTAVTDIFASTAKGGFFDSLKGTERSISESGEIGSMVRSVAENSVGVRKVVAPVSTKSEAEAFILRYLKQCTADDNKLKQLKPTVDKLIYVPCEIADSGITIPSLGRIAPKSVGRIDLIKTLLI